MYKPRPSSQELFNKDHNAGRESLGHLIYHFKFVQFIIDLNIIEIDLSNKFTFR